jgi:hypothetical protein
MAQTVLVVEDEVKIRELLRSYLERAGLDVVTTASGAEAITLAARAEPDLVRRLGTVDAVVIGVGSMVGAGVFAAFGPAARAAGTGLLVGLDVAVVVAYCNATASAQLAAVYPASGGTYVTAGNGSGTGGGSPPGGDSWSARPPRARRWRALGSTGPRDGFTPRGGAVGRAHHHAPAHVGDDLAPRPPGRPQAWAGRPQAWVPPGHWGGGSQHPGGSRGRPARCGAGLGGRLPCRGRAGEIVTLSLPPSAETIDPLE